MKKNMRFFYVGVIVMLCLIASGYGQKSKSASDVTISINIEYAKSAVQNNTEATVYVDGDEIGKIKAGSTGKYDVSLTKGNHEIWAVKEGADKIIGSDTLRFSTDKTALNYKLADTSEKAMTLTEAADPYEEVLKRAKLRSGAPVAEIDSIDADGTLVIHLYEVIAYDDEGSHTSTWDWYYINPKTLKGTDFMGEPVDLSK